MPTQISYPIADSRSYLWFVGSLLLAPFCYGQWTVASAPWLVAALSLRFVRSQKTWIGFILLALSAAAATALFAWQGSIPFSGPTLAGVIVFSALISPLPLLADRYISSRLPGFVSTLSYPCIATAAEYLAMDNNPWGSFGAMAYTQYGNLALMQIVSITGIWGLNFLINWFGSVVNWAWQNAFIWREIRSGALVFAGVLIAVLTYGGARLTFAPTPQTTVRIASFTAMDNRVEVPALWQLLPNDRDSFRRKTRAIHQRYLDETERQARAGARLVLWPEGAGIGAMEDEEGLLEKGGALAKREGIYLAMPLFLKAIKDEMANVNKLVVLDPQGQIVFEHYKFGGNMFEGSQPGNGQLKTFATPFGTITGAICWDMDFPANIAQSSDIGADILLAPAADFLAVHPLHAEMSVFRAIENGISLVRQADNGLSLASDPYGRILASMDHFSRW